MAQLPPTSPDVASSRPFNRLRRARRSSCCSNSSNRHFNRPRTTTTNNNNSRPRNCPCLVLSLQSSPKGHGMAPSSRRSRRPSSTGGTSYPTTSRPSTPRPLPGAASQATPRPISRRTKPRSPKATTLHHRARLEEVTRTIKEAERCSLEAPRPWLVAPWTRSYGPNVRGGISQTSPRRRRPSPGFTVLR